MPWARIVDVASFLEDYPCDPDGGELCIDLEIEDDLLPGTTTPSASGLRTAAAP